MNRVIKFRAFSRIFSENQMFFDVDIINKEDGQWFSFNNGTRMYQSGERVNIQQFTGLTDKNGKEIYEGDIVEFIGGTCDYLSLNHYGQNHSIGTILIVSKLLSGFTLQLPRHKDIDAPNIVGNIDNYQFWNHQKSFKVIGNIYENPELLNNQ